MPANEADPIHFAERERDELHGLMRQRTCPQHPALRARIVLVADAGVGIRPSAERLGITRTTVCQWRRRWVATPGARVAERLADAPHPGAPVLYCLQRRDGLPHHGPSLGGPGHERAGYHALDATELADEAIQRGIVSFISQSSVGRILGTSRPQAPSRAPLAQRQARPAVRREVP